MLLVEDRPSDRYLIMEALERNGLLPVEFEWANSLRTAKEYLRNHQYEVILLDLNLGDSMGLDTLADIASESGGSAIVVVSGTLLESPEACTALGASAFLDKDELSDQRLCETLQSIALNAEPSATPETPVNAGAVVSINTCDIHAASLNRIGLMDRLHTDLTNGVCDGHLLALHFDEFDGSSGTDELKKAVMTRLISKRLEALLIHTDEPAVLAHMGQAEFGIWLPCSDRFGAEKLADFLAERARDHAINRDLPELSSLRVGIASARYCDDASVLIVRARQALQRASRYRINYSVHVPPDANSPQRRDQLQADLEASISPKHCRFQFCPIIELSSKASVAAAIDVQWYLPGHPAFDDHLFHQITQHKATNERALAILCQRACDQLGHWSGERSQHWAIQIPLSKHVLRLEDWSNRLAQHFEASHTNPRQVWLTVKEADLITAGPDTREHLAKLSAAGYVIVIDEYEGLLPSPAEIGTNSADLLIYDAKTLSQNSRLQQTVAGNAGRFSLMIRNLQGKEERQEALEHGFRYGAGFVA